VNPRRYPATLVRVVDGDTVDLDVDLGFRVWARQRFRLVGINCPEATAPGGSEATAFTKAWLAEHVEIEVESQREDVYARWLGVIWAGEETLNNALVVSKHAEPHVYR
jgi:micrococcal nuclease